MLGRRVSRDENARLLAEPPESRTPLLTIDPQDIIHNYNRRPFRVRHRLADLAAFQMPELAAMIRRLLRHQIICRRGRLGVDADFDESFRPGESALALESALEDVEGLSAYIYVSNPEKDPEYQSLIAELLSEIARSIHEVHPLVTWYSTYLFISGFDSTTPYHMVREMNFLLQVRGEKNVLLWDQGDPEVMTDAQKDALLAGIGRRPDYREGMAQKAMRFVLKPGQGVHRPFIAPHAVHTSSRLSISLAVTFRTKQSDVWTAAHGFNYHLRRIGLRPAPVGRSWSRDVFKARSLSLLSAGKAILARHKSSGLDG